MFYISKSNNYRQTIDCLLFNRPLIHYYIVQNHDKLDISGYIIQNIMSCRSVLKQLAGALAAIG